MEKVEVSISNSEVKRAFLRLVRTEEGFNEHDMKVIFRAVHKRIMNNYPQSIDWMYNLVRREHNNYVTALVRERNKQNIADMRDLHR